MKCMKGENVPRLHIPHSLDKCSRNVCCNSLGSAGWHDSNLITVYIYWQGPHLNLKLRIQNTTTYITHKTQFDYAYGRYLGTHYISVTSYDCICLLDKARWHDNKVRSNFSIIPHPHDCCKVRMGKFSVCIPVPGFVNQPGSFWWFSLVRPLLRNINLHLMGG